VNPKRFVPSEMLRLNTSVPVSAQPNRLGVLAGDLQGFPNGRRLTDDVLDIEVQALEGAAVSGIVPALAAGDAVNANDKAFGTTFPYVALPANTGVNTQSGGAITPPVGGGFPAGPLLNVLLATLLIGSGVWLFRRSPQWSNAPATA
jgi:hypothetical protein